MGFFNAFRDNGGPTHYGPQYTPVTADVLVVGLLVGFSLILFSTIVVLPGIKGKQSLLAFVKVFLTLYIGAVIVVCNYGYGWKSGSVHTRTFYKARNLGEQKHEIHADVGLRVGLRGINVTLKGTPTNQWNETINYNERFSWEWNQGRLGFGPYAGRINRELRAAQYRGLPLPILSIVEYFTLDGEKIRWGRAYREAGYYTHVMMWTAFPLWLLCLILFKIDLSLGALFLALTGCSLLLANILFSVLSSSPSPSLAIPFDDGVIKLQYGWCFILVLITGILCVLGAAVVIFMDYRYPRELAKFFGRSVQDDDQGFDEGDTDAGNCESGRVGTAAKDNGHTAIPMENNSPTEPSAGYLSHRRFTSPGLRALRRLPSSELKVPTTSYLRPGYVNITIDENGMIKAETPTRPRPPVVRMSSKSSLLAVQIPARKLSNVEEAIEPNEESQL